VLVETKELGKNSAKPRITILIGYDKAHSQEAPAGDGLLKFELYCRSHGG
jgi:hypothetical protein